jgi:hypothetical protein
MEVVTDVFRGFPETWLIVPEGNGKSTLLAQIALYGADFSDSPWIPVGASSAKQARIIYDQAAGFVERTPWLDERFKCFGGYKLIRSIANGGIGIEVFAAEAKTGDGVIPFPFAIVDELHRHDDLRLYSLWKGKLRKRGGQILTISTAGEPETPFENTRDEIRRRATKRDRDGAHLRAEGPGLVLHEWMVASDDDCNDMAKVKAANPLWSITEQTLREDFASPTMDLGDWKRLKCNRPTRSASRRSPTRNGTTPRPTPRSPPARRSTLGIDVAFKWDTTASCRSGRPRTTACLARRRPGAAARRLEPPPGRDQARRQLEYRAAYNDRDGRDGHVRQRRDRRRLVDRGRAGHHRHRPGPDPEAEGGRLQRLHRRTAERHAQAHRRPHAPQSRPARHRPPAPRRRVRFDRASQVRQNARAQDRRVIDALTAAAMVVEHSNREPAVSVYEETIYG